MLGNVKRYIRIYLAYGYTDLRYGIDGLARVVQDHFSLDPFQKGCLFLFCGRRTGRIKGLLWEGDGFVLIYKRLEAGHFQWPRTASEAREITPEQFTWLMQGLAVEQKKGYRKSHRKEHADRYDDRFCAKHRNFPARFRRCIPMPRQHKKCTWTSCAAFKNSSAYFFRENRKKIIL